ncbi:hypothetical protein DSO57_1038001 [Entomophthora muscae]|uniref:Uncharacterized protein n=1 Tax=Entomophthora muscae TaxID=34485 RepID=A0ACC2UJI4_9FUNG|nr:hypothetical protein DSO57_1038001 [Entomophthora muscae]
MEVPGTQQASKTVSEEISNLEVAPPQTTTMKATESPSRSKTKTLKPSSKPSTTSSSEKTSKPEETSIQGLTDSDAFISEQVAPEVTIPSQASVAEAAEKDYESLAEAFGAEVPGLLPQSTLPQAKSEDFENLLPSKTSSDEIPDTKLVHPQTTMTKTTQSLDPSGTRGFLPSSDFPTASPSENTSIHLSSESQLPTSSEGLVYQSSERVMSEVAIPSSQTSAAEKDFGSLSRTFEDKTSGSLTLSQNQYHKTLQPSETAFDDAQSTKSVSLQATTTVATQGYAHSETSATKSYTKPLANMPSENVANELNIALPVTSDSTGLYSTFSEKLEPEATLTSLVSVTETSEKGNQSLLNALSAELNESLPRPTSAQDPSQDSNIIHAPKAVSEEASIDILVSSHTTTEMTTLSPFLSTKIMANASLGAVPTSAQRNIDKMLEDAVVISSDLKPTPTMNTGQVIAPTIDSETSYSSSSSAIPTGTELKLQPLTSTSESLRQPPATHDVAQIEANTKENISNSRDGYPQISQVRTTTDGSWSSNGMPSMSSADLPTSDTNGSQTSSQTTPRFNVGNLDHISATLSKPLSMPTKGAVANHYPSESMSDLAPKETLLETSNVEELTPRVPTQGMPEYTDGLQPKISNHQNPIPLETLSQTYLVDHIGNVITRSLQTTTERIELPSAVVLPSELVKTQDIQASEIQPTTTKKTNPYSDEALTQERSIVETNIPTPTLSSESSQEKHPANFQGLPQEESTTAIPLSIQQTENPQQTLALNSKMGHTRTQEEPSMPLKAWKMNKPLLIIPRR